MRPGAASAQVRDDARWSTVALVLAAGIVAAFQVGKAAAATPQLQAGLGLGLAAAGWLTGVFAILGFVGGIPAGTLVARLGERRVLMAGLASAALGAAIGAGAGAYGLLLASRVIEGFGFLLITVAGPAILERAVPASRRDFAFALWSCFMPAGIALAMLAGPQFGDWRDLWWTSAWLAAAALLAAPLLVPAGAPRAAMAWSRLGADALDVVTGKAPLLLALCFALYSLMFFALFSFLPVLLTQQMGFAPITAGLLAALASAGNIVGNLGAGYLMTRGARRLHLLLAAFAVTGAAGLGIFLQVFDAPATFVLCVLFSSVGGLVPATLLATTPRVVHTMAQAPMAVGLLMQGSNLGQIVGPVAVGAAIQAYGWSAAGGIVLASALMAAAAARLVRADG